MRRLASPFIHLHTHSEYSILDSSCKISALLDRAAEDGMDALALTDHGVMSGVVKFYRQATKRGIKPILGCEVYVAPGDRRDRSTRSGDRYYHLVLLAENEVGYRNLLQVVSRAHTEGFYYRPRADKEILREHAEGLIALSACESGEIPRMLKANRHDDAVGAAQELQSIFGEDNFFIEIQHHGTERDLKLRAQLIELARSLDMPLVATNDIHYLSPDDRLAHEVLLNIRANKTLNDPDHRTFDGQGFHFRTTAEMQDLFSDVPDALENTRKIADRCHVELDFGRVMIPPYDLPDGRTDPGAYLRELTYAGAADRYPEINQTIRDRLDYELSVIAKMEYATYFLIVWDFIHYAHQHEIPVGPGRGSAAGSLVAYCLGITNVDALKYNLIFERFLNPDRISMPDFDIDFCIKGRDQVIDYVRDKYGGRAWWERIAQIATYDRMAARSVVRDVGRVLGVPYSTTDRIAKMVPFGWKLKVATERVAELRTLYETDEEIRQIIDIGLRLEGLTRNTSTHAAGVVIAPDALANHVPLLRLGEEEFVTQFDMVDIEAIGLLKFDFLGLRNLTLIDSTCKSLREHAGVDLDVNKIPLDDAKTFELISAGKTAGIFQLESSGMTSLICKVKPDRIDDLIALLALYRPGPLESGMTDQYVERRRGAEEVTYPHEDLREVLEDTYGLPIYQDQLMLMAQHLAGFTLAEADILRKAMGKKNPEMMASLRQKFVAGCVERGRAETLANSTFDDMEKFSRYGFNKSHTTAYAFISYWTAYLKAHYPEHFMASLLTSVQGDSDKVAEYISECREMDIEVLPPDICESFADFAPIDAHHIRFGFGAVKHVGRNAIAAIIEARKDGPFLSYFDLCRRVTSGGLDREAMEALVKAGAFDCLGASRRGLLRHLTEGLEIMSVARTERATGQQSFFSDDIVEVKDPVIDEEEFAKADLLSFEKELLGLYISAHPLDEHRELLDIYCRPLSRISELSEGDSTILGGRIKALRRIETRRGGQMAFLTLEDSKSEAEITVFTEALEAAGDLVQEDRLVAICISAGLRNGEINLVAEKLMALDQVGRQRKAVSVVLTLDGEVVDPDSLSTLQRALRSHPGQAPLRLRLVDPAGSILVLAHSRYAVAPSEALRSALNDLTGIREIVFANGHGGSR